METREFYDVRSPDIHSGLFDLRRWPAQMRGGLVSHTNRHLAQVAPHTPELVLNDAGYARILEPDKGPNGPWGAGVQEAHRAMEIAVGAVIPVFVRLERVYRFHFSAFDKSNWVMLANLFSQLPGWKGTKPYPHWFGLPVDSPPALWGKVEASGLRITGELQSARWAGWDTWLRRNMHEFPRQ
ncbi:MAG: hypothetical protein ACI8RZ_006982 [Myxococcota bacterium]|jgi:hypothetical protein